MAERKWGTITSGVTFESLATTIVFFEDPKASLFGRRGKDGGQDARSGDGTRVFQAKHHVTGSAAAAIRDAKSEAEKIEKYRQPGHSRHEQWQGVTHWRLVTNAAFSGFYAALEASVPTMTASQRLALADVLEAVAPFHPREAASLVGALRRQQAPDETIEGVFGAKHLGQNEILLSLAWPLFGGAMGAESQEDREAVLRELCALTEAETELALQLPRGLPNDGKRAGALVTRVLEGGPQFWSEYDDTAKVLCIELVVALMKQQPKRGQIALLKALVEPILSVERRQSWNDDRTVTWRTFEIAPGSSAWSARETVLTQVKQALVVEATPAESRAQLWHVFARARDGSALERLKWTYAALTKRQANLNELTEAREVWDWHRRFDTNPQVKAAADQLENLYTTNDLANEFEPLLSHDHWRERDTRALAKAATLASAGQPEEIAGFVERAVSFLGDENKLYLLGSIAWSMGEYAESHDAVRQFVSASLERPTITARSNLGVQAAVRWVACVRMSDHPARARPRRTALGAVRKRRTTCEPAGADLLSRPEAELGRRVHHR